MRAKGRLIDDNDPLALHPPPSETTEERNTRLRREQEAQAVSDKIDADLERSLMSEKRGPKPIKILLLGTSWGDIFLSCNC
jgi:guanine nucleotide-binding protein alpha-1 subunit